MEDSFLVNDIILIACIAAALFFWYRHQRAAKDRRAGMREAIVGYSGFHVTEYVASRGKDLTGLAFDSPRKVQALVSSPANGPVDVRFAQPDEIVSVAVVEDGSMITETSRGSQMGGMVVGALALGGVGAVIGGLSGKTTSKGAAQTMALQVTIADLAAPLHSVILLNERNPIPRTSPIYLAAKREADKWKAMLEVVIRDSARVTAVTARPREPDPIAGSVADEIRKLAALRDEGFLSPAEFEAQKAKLLRQ